MNEQLKPCSKCGGELILYTGHRLEYIRCYKCGDRTDYDNIIEAVADKLNRPIEDNLRAKWERIPWNAIRERDDMASEWFQDHPEEEEDLAHAIIREWMYNDAPDGFA